MDNIKIGGTIYYSNGYFVTTHNTKPVTYSIKEATPEEIKVFEHE